jgi:hypothetical protein
VNDLLLLVLQSRRWDILVPNRSKTLWLEYLSASTPIGKNGIDFEADGTEQQVDETSHITALSTRD